MPTMPSEWKHFIFEYWDVKPEHLEEWKAYYKRNVITPLLKAEAVGRTSFMFVAGMPWRTDPHRVMFPHDMLRTAPVQGIVNSTRPPATAIQTNVSIDLHALLQHEWNICVAHFMTGQNMKLHAAWEREWEKLNPDWRERHPDLNKFEDVISREMFQWVNNHWDVSYDLVGVWSDIDGSYQDDKVY